MSIECVVMFSGGAGSWAAAKKAVERYSPDKTVLLFTDVQGNNPSPHVGEDEDTYRFVQEAAENVGAPLVILNEGMDIWDVFKKNRWIGNSQLAHCSFVLKQKPARKWIEDNCCDDTTIVLGIDWTETHRIPAIEKGYLPRSTWFPLCEEPYLTKGQILEWLDAEGVARPRLYALGFAHNNCGGGCVKAGKAQWRHLYEVMPERYAEWERRESELADYLAKDGKKRLSILTETVRGEKLPLPLVTLRERIEAQGTLFDDEGDIGGCGCFVDGE